MYPLLFKSIYKEVIWGGKKLSEFYGRQLHSDHTGESWDISYRDKEMGRVINGIYAGRAFSSVVGECGSGSRIKWLGRRFAQAEFPLLIKIIDAGDNLSVQVHPNDAQALNISGERQGKCEMWYVLDAPSDSSLIIGLKNGVSRDAFAEVADENNGVALEGMLNRLSVKRGDIIYIPAGLIHSITKGVMVVEIQQNSDITYRLYDYGRVGLDGKPRQLNIDQAMAVIDFENSYGKIAVPGIKVKDTPFTYYIANRHFCVIVYELNGTVYTEQSDPDKFFIFTCVEGDCVIRYNDSSIYLSESYSMFIPAALGEYAIEAKHCVLLKSFVPDIDRDFYQPLLKAGYTKDEINIKTAVEQELETFGEGGSMHEGTF